MVMVCKKCRRAFRKDLGQFDETDEYCPHCDNHYVVEAKTAKPMYGVESEDARVDNQYVCLNPCSSADPNARDCAACTLIRVRSSIPASTFSGQKSRRKPRSDLTKAACLVRCGSKRQALKQQCPRRLLFRPK